MKIITLWQPWATWILWGWKTIETRTHANFACLKGETIGIHAGKKFDKDALEIAREFLSMEKIIKHFEADYPLGKIICTARVVDTGWLNKTHGEKALIECYSNRFGLILKEVKPIDPPIDAKGSQGIWEYKIETSQLEDK